MAGCHRTSRSCPPRRGKSQRAGRGSHRPDRDGQPEAGRRDQDQVRRGAAGGRGRPARRPVPRRPDPVQGPGLHGRGRGDGVRARAAARPGDPASRPSWRRSSWRPASSPLGRTNVPGAWHHGDHRAAELPAGAQPVEPRSLDRRLVRRVGRRGRVAAWCAVAHANDGGGSIRIPASECGLVGLKPTRARVSQGPVTGEAWAGSTIDGCVARTVRDAAGVLDVISTPMPGDPYYAPPLPRPLAREVGADPGRLRIGVLDRPGVEGYLDDPECRAAVARAARAAGVAGPPRRAVRARGDAGAGVPPALHQRSSPPTPRPRSRRFEMLLGRRIGEDEIEPRNAAHRRAGAGAQRAVPTCRAGPGSGCGRAGWRTGGPGTTCS